MKKDMHKFIRYGFLLLSVSYLPAIGQTASRNYVKVETMLNAAGTENTTVIQYYDGLGRPDQLADNSLSADGSYVHTHQTYNNVGMPNFQYLPAVGDTSGEYIPLSDGTLSAALKNDYEGEGICYASTSYDVLGRVTVESPPGVSFIGRGIYHTYGANAANDVRNYQLVSAGRVKLSGYYASGTLTYEEAKDGDGHTECIYKNLFGEKVLERRLADGKNYDTYYVYTDCGELAFVLPPAASASMTSVGTQWHIDQSEPLLQYAYYYQYDNLGRCVRKKLPGCHMERFTYDHGGRVVLRDDGNLRLKGRQMFVLYDTFGREAVRGTCKATSLPSENMVVRATYTGNGPLDGYSSNLPLTGVEIMLTTYYDDYAFLSRLSDEEKSAATYASRSGYPAKTAFTKGLPTGSVVHQLGDAGKYTVSASYYDRHGRVVCTRSTNHLGGTEVTHTGYTFTGKPSKEYHRHTAAGRKMLTEEHTYLYDRGNRLQSDTLSVNGAAITEVARYEYDNLGRLSKKTFGNSRSQSYSYNLRGWLTGISNSVFSETLAYNTSVDGLTPKNPSYTGNISAMRWKYVSTSHDCQYRYDKQSRLTEATYGEGDAVSHQTNPFNEQFSYDLMGNVTSIRRNGKISGSTYGCVDDLVLTYTGNQLKKVTDTGRDGTYSGAFDFEDGADEEIEYEYDKNGNLVKDLNRKISQITYNCLNLSEKVEMKHQVNSSWVSYGYDGMGRKLYAEYSESLLKSIMPQSSVMDILQAIYGGSVASSSSSSSGTVSSGQSAASSVIKSTASSTVVKKLDLTSEIQGKSIDPNATTLVSRHNTSRTDYCGNVVYEDSVCRLLFSQGYITFNKNTGKAEPHYYLKDHLGNVRVVMTGAGVIEQANHYYAFGGLLGTSFNGDKQKYKYNGKELDRFLGWDMLDYGARWYDSKLQCWSTVDPLAEKYYHLSPYVYCADNPVKYTDPNGKAFEPWIALQTDNRGNAIWIQNKSTKAFIRSMSRFGQTTIGRKLLGAFIPKGMKQYGVKGTGEFSDIAFQINEFNMSDKERQKDYLWGRDDNGIPCQISGALSAQKTDENEFVLNLKIDVSGSEKELQETIVHEFTLHGEKIEKTIKILRSKGVDAAIEYFNNSTQAEEHKKNKYYYDSTMKELINIK